MQTASHTGSRPKDELAPPATAARAGPADWRPPVESELARWRRREALMVWVRLLVFGAAAVSAFFLRFWPPVALVVSGGLLAGFGAAVREHRRVRRERCFCEHQVVVLDEMDRRWGGKVVRVRDGARPTPASGPHALESILDSGPLWALSEQEIDDLDLYQDPVGVFGLLNRTSSVFAARRLSHWLEHPCLDAERIAARQQAVQWLAAHGPQRVRLMAGAVGLRTQDEPLQELLAAVRAAEPLPWGPGIVLALRGSSLVVAAALAAAVVSVAVGAGRLAMVLALPAVLHAILYTRWLGAPLRRALPPWRGLEGAAGAYLEAARRAQPELPETGLLQTIRDALQPMLRDESLPSLCRMLPWASSGGMFHVMFNHLFFYDLHVAAPILRRVVRDRDELIAGLAALADMEGLCSLACLADEQPVACWPRFVAERMLIIEDGVHPLIAPDHVVANSLHLHAGCGTWIITGSNMAGKSTFLRMAGLNMLLAQAGGPAMARRMELVPLRLLTDLRIRDNLAREESYFLAEVRQLHRMVSPAPGPPLLGLIDEPFRGTNSQERVAASLALVQHLRDSDHLFVVATHEEALTGLAGGAAANHHFREVIGRDGEVFDHRLRPGPATVRNALRLMEREGYPPSLIESARRQMTPEEGP